jgi:drug/metabolite transporter (DMT)-like permease
MNHEPISIKSLPPIIGMIVLDVAAPILLLIGLKMSLPENVALLNNFEIVATTLIAALFFKEMIPVRVRWGIVLIFLATFVLSFENIQTFTFSWGSLFVLLAAICWGLENNLTRILSKHNPLFIVMLKGIFSGICSLGIAVIMKETTSNIWMILSALLLGFVTYGLSIYFYVTAQKQLGAAKTSSYYAISPFIGAMISLVIFLEVPGILFFISLAMMIIGTYLVSTPSSIFKHSKNTH